MKIGKHRADIVCKSCGTYLGEVCRIEEVRVKLRELNEIIRKLKQTQSLSKAKKPSEDGK